MADSREARMALLTKDHLSELARKKRQFLLGISVLGILVAWVGFVPQKVPFFGISLTQTNQKDLMWLILILNIYYLFAFLIYSITDITKFIVDYFRIDDEPEDVKDNSVEAKNEHEEKKDHERVWDGTFTIANRKFDALRVVWMVHGFRILIESVLPSILGVISIGSLLSAILS